MNSSGPRKTFAAILWAFASTHLGYSWAVRMTLRITCGICRLVRIWVGSLSLKGFPGLELQVSVA